MTPRTACTAIGELLCERFGGEFIPSDDILDARGLILVDKKHSTLSDLLKHKILATEEAKSLLKVAAVRNPFDSLRLVIFQTTLKVPAPAWRSRFLGESPSRIRQEYELRPNAFVQWLGAQSILQETYQEAPGISSLHVC